MEVRGGKGSLGLGHDTVQWIGIMTLRTLSFFATRFFRTMAESLCNIHAQEGIMVMMRDSKGEEQ